MCWLLSDIQFQANFIGLSSIYFLHNKHFLASTCVLCMSNRQWAAVCNWGGCSWRQQQLLECSRAHRCPVLSRHPRQVRTDHPPHARQHRPQPSQPLLCLTAFIKPGVLGRSTQGKLGVVIRVILTFKIACNSVTLQCLVCVLDLCVSMWAFLLISMVLVCGHIVPKVALDIVELWAESELTALTFPKHSRARGLACQNSCAVLFKWHALYKTLKCWCWVCYKIITCGSYPWLSYLPCFPVTVSLVVRRSVHLVKKGKVIIWMSGQFNVEDLCGSAKRPSASSTGPLTRCCR